MIIDEEIVAIINKRDERYQKFLKRTPKKLSLRTLKRELNYWDFHVYIAQELEETEITELHDGLDFISHFTDVAHVHRIRYNVSTFYIEKLEKELERLEKELEKLKFQEIPKGAS